MEAETTSQWSNEIAGRIILKYLFLLAINFVGGGIMLFLLAIDFVSGRIRTLFMITFLLVIDFVSL